MIVIPADRLGADVLTALIEEFVLQEGTDYGQHETGLANKVKQVRAQIDKGDVLITFDDETESCNLMTKLEYKRYSEAV
ncbi:MAG: hypothetical protein COC20_05875 [Cellvibrionales bacterium]|nr:MAG: hypothetical protein COC20_05875 [Cellvibrionales bacterium]